MSLNQWPKLFSEFKKVRVVTTIIICDKCEINSQYYHIPSVIIITVFMDSALVAF